MGGGVEVELARLAAKALAQAEDRVLFQGPRAVPTLVDLAVQVLSTNVESKGMLFENNDPPVKVDTKPPPANPQTPYP